jgi:hypothetical protein
MPPSSTAKALLRIAVSTASKVRAAASRAPMAIGTYHEGSLPRKKTKAAITAYHTGIVHRLPRGNSGDGPLTSAM